MPKKGHTEEQIIAALKQHESGAKTADICLSQATFYLWKKQYAGAGCSGSGSVTRPADTAGDRGYTKKRTSRSAVWSARRLHAGSAYRKGNR